jgi:hypothetical protein
MSRTKEGQGQEISMNWEYAEVYTDGDFQWWAHGEEIPRQKKLLGALNAMGELGWELVGPTVDPTRAAMKTLYLFKRPKS